MCQGRFRPGIRKRFFTRRAVEHWNRLPREAATAPSLTLFKKPLDRALTHMVSIWGCPVQGQELDLMILVGPFQLRTSYEDYEVIFSL